MVQPWTRACRPAGPSTMTASRNPVMSMSMFRSTQARAMRKVGLLARWSMLASPSAPSPVMSSRFVMVMHSLHRRDAALEY